MAQFIQLHILTSYPPSNLNRDDLGRPKTAFLGGTQRLRISSQCLKRSWRKSEVFEDAARGQMGVRTKDMGKMVYSALLTGRPLREFCESPEAADSRLADKDLRQRAWEIARVFVDGLGGKGKAADEEQEADEDSAGKTKRKGKKEKKTSLDRDTLCTEQMVFYSPGEIDAMAALVSKLRTENRPPRPEEIKALLLKNGKGVDVAMFGRMLAAEPNYNIEAAVQVGHAISVHKVAVEDDYFTAVDDLNKGGDDRGAAHIGETEFAAGLFYLYVCVNRDLLVKNLSGDKELATRALGALTRAAVTVSPSGKQNSFASRAYASFVLAEKGSQQPRSLSVAFLKAVEGKDLRLAAVEALESERASMETAYGKCADSTCVMDTVRGKGKLEDIRGFVAG